MREREEERFRESRRTYQGEYMREKEKRAGMTLVCFLLRPYFILPGCRKDLRLRCLCGLRTALRSLLSVAAVAAEVAAVPMCLGH